MPGWLINILVSVAVSLGNVGLHWLVTKFPGIPASVVAIVENLLNQLNQNKAVAKQLVQQAKCDAKSVCAVK